MKILRAIKVGLRDGFDQPHEFNVGMTYDSPVKQWLYDQASILGQRISRMKEGA